MSEKDKYGIISLICAIKNNNNKHAKEKQEYREQTGGFQKGIGCKDERNR